MRLTLFSLLFFTIVCFPLVAEDRPNIVWIAVDDMSANFSCYGETTIQTPHVDQLAKQGTRFSRAYATSPVCSTFRSAMITGMYQNSIGVHHHRSGRGKHRIVLPEGVEPVPKLFQQHGYWTCMGSGVKGLDSRGAKSNSTSLGKADYNFDWDTSIYNSHDWADRAPDQPFFMQVQLHGGKIRGASTNTYKKTEDRMDRDFGGRTDPDSVTLPPYYPRDPVLLRDWATYLDSVRITDWHVGQVIKRLQSEALLDNTIVIFFTDHGISHARGKQFLYDEGTHIPLVIAGPGIASGETREDMVEHIDVAALSLAAAGIDIPEKMQGKNILATDYQPREAVYAARDRCGEAADRIRTVRTDKFLYLKNFYPERPFLMPSNYKDSKLIIKHLRQLNQQNKLPELSKKLLFSPTRPAEELYLYQDDKWQITNLAEDPQYSAQMDQHRKLLKDWIQFTGDPGPETTEVYIMETEDQMKSTKNKVSRENYRKNSEIYRNWFQKQPH